MNPSDADGDFQSLVETWQRKVFRFVSSILGPYSDADAEEVTQEVFLQVHRQLHTFRANANFATWLYTIARSRAIDRRRTARFRLHHISTEALFQMTANSPTPLTEAQGAERRQTIAQCLESLPELYRTLLYLHYWQDASIDEIAGYTGLVPGTVKSYLARARNALSRHLTTRGVDSYE